MDLAVWIEYRHRALLVRLIDLEGDAVALGVLGAIARGILVQTVIEALEEVTRAQLLFRQLPHAAYTREHISHCGQ